MGMLDRVKRSWETLFNKDPTDRYSIIGPGYSQRPDRPRLSRGNERSITTSIYVRMALDISAVNFSHCIVNEDDCYVSKINSGLNECLTLAANKDQSARAFIQDVAMTMMDSGSVAILPIDYDDNVSDGNRYDVLSLRAGEIIQWYPDHIKVRVYDDITGIKKDITVAKEDAAIIENPFYAIMNEPNSTMQRLIRKLSLLDVTDEKTASGKLDVIIQLPYVVKSEGKRKIAEERRTAIEMQLSGSKYGIAYTEGTEKITQLNRPVENNLMPQIEFLTQQVISQLGMTQAILDGTATEQVMLNYNTRTIDPIVEEIVLALKRTYLSREARANKQSIKAFRDPFKLVPLAQLSDIGDSFTRNRILTSNEVRQIIGRRPSDDPEADKLVNSNIKQESGTNSKSQDAKTADQAATNTTEGKIQNG